MRGNVGLQIIHTDQSSGSFLAANADTPAQEIVPVSDGTTYTDYLPQINIVLQLPDSQAFRFSVAKELARPRMDQLKATEESGYNSATGEPSGSGGNARAGPLARLGVRRVVRKVLCREQGLRVCRRVLQGPDELHLRPDHR